MNVPTVDAPRSAADDLALGMLVEELTAKLHAGERVDLESCVRVHPEYAEQLRQLLPALTLLADLGNSAATQGTAFASGVTAPGEIVGTLGDFRLLREIGRGGMGVVYEAEQISLNRRVALKVLPFAAVLDPRQLQRFQNEARAAAGLHHTNIVPVYFVGCERGVHYYAMQFIDGQDLASVMAQRRAQADSRGISPKPPETKDAQTGPAVASAALPGTPTRPIAGLSTERSPRSPEHYRTVARLGIQAAEALDHAHQQGIVHRDVKPANLLVDIEGRLWVTDFGLAHVQSDARLTITGDLVGTLRYMSPEQALAKRVIVDHRTDIYSLGATLYELLTLEPVFAGNDRQELLRQIAFEEPKAARRHNKSIPAELEIIVSKALEKNPADRYATAQELADDLERFLKDESIMARRPPFNRRLRAWCRRHKPLVTGVVAIAVTLLLLGSAALWSEERQRAATKQAVADDLKEADLWQQQEQWAKARQALERANGRLEGSVLQSLQDKVWTRRREMAMVERLEEVQLKAATISGRRGDFDLSGADRAYQAVFVAEGLDVGALPGHEIAQRVRASAFRIQLVTALDYWAFMKEPGGGREQLRAIARLADDDPWRQRLRDALRSQNGKALEELAEGEAVLTQPAPYMVLLSSHLVEQAKSPAAGIRLLRQAQERHPEDFWINFKLAIFLSPNAATSAEAIGFCRAALVVQPRNPALYDCLGTALRNQHKPSEAAAAHRKAIELKPDYAAPYINLGNDLLDQNKLPEAEAAYRKVVDLEPDSVLGYCNLGYALLGQKKLPEAVVAFRKSIDLHPEHVKAHGHLGLNLYILANAHRGLGLVLGAQHKLPEAEEAFRKARAAEQCAQLEAKLDYILSGKTKPAGAAERVALANYCQQSYKLLYRASARLFSEAFAEEPKLANDLGIGNRYNAACAAALAGCGKGKDAAKLDPKEYARLRGQALVWLRADLVTCGNLLDMEPVKARPEVRRKMQHWQHDTDFDGVRGAEALAKLPDAERQAWQQLWAAVADTLGKAQQATAASK